MSYPDFLVTQENSHSVKKADSMIVMTCFFLLRLLTPGKKLGTMTSVDNQGLEMQKQLKLNVGPL